MWGQSADIVTNLGATIIYCASTQTPLLNLPECYADIQMIATRDDGEFKTLYNSVLKQPAVGLRDKVKAASSNNM
jgi:hypothetical protein